MKTAILILFLTFGFGGMMTARAQDDSPQITVRVGNQKKESRSQLTVKFLSLVEDSRCPEGTNCVWAGNAKIKVTVSKRGSQSKTFELNTNLGAKGETYEGYAFNLVSLTPTPKGNIRINRNGYTATFAVSRLTR